MLKFCVWNIAVLFQWGKWVLLCVKEGMAHRHLHDLGVCLVKDRQKNVSNCFLYCIRSFFGFCTLFKAFQALCSKTRKELGLDKTTFFRTDLFVVEIISDGLGTRNPWVSGFGSGEKGF